MSQHKQIIRIAKLTGRNWHYMSGVEKIARTTRSNKYGVNGNMKITFAYILKLELHSLALDCMKKFGISIF
jgi:hypothetical protein